MKAEGGIFDPISKEIPIAESPLNSALWNLGDVYPSVASGRCPKDRGGSTCAIPSIHAAKRDRLPLPKYPRGLG